MLIKSADDKTRDIEILEGLLSHPAGDADTRRKIEMEIRSIQSGAKGERDAAYEIDFYFEPSKNWAVIHDLRVEHKGRVAQIDHILVNRFLDVWVCESKRFSEGIAINEYGECSAFHGGKPYGVPSPFEQNSKHCTVLKQICDDGMVDLPKRLGFSIKPDFRSLVLVSKNARIVRPNAKIEGLEEIIKVDQIKARIEKFIKKESNHLAVAKIIGSDTLKAFANRLAALHSPATFDWYAKFGLAKQAAASIEIGNKSPAPVAADASSQPRVEVERKSKLVCLSCETVVSYSVARYCWSHKARFGGNVYCMDCQKKVRPAEGGMRQA